VLDGNGAVWLELLVLNAFESEETALGTSRIQAHLCPELGVPQDF
jgi:hypothetical protein